MNKKLIPGVVCLLLGSSQVTMARGMDPFYFGLKAGIMDAEGISEYAANAGVDVGYRFNRYLSVEGQFTDTFIEGETGSGKEWEFSTISAFAVVRSATPVKFKGKIGITEFNHHGPGDDPDPEFSAGVGIGFWVGGALMEVEYTKLSDEVKYLSLGANFFF